MITDGPKVKLIDATRDGFNLAIASARTCYSSKGIIFPYQMSTDAKNFALREKIAAQTLKAGHLTTRQHINFVFAISDISRHCVWSALHHHPYYNSEQVSQRYVPVATDQIVLPQFSAVGRDIFIATITMQQQSYDKLRCILQEDIAKAYFSIFTARKASADKWQGDIAKRVMEIARYVLPIATATYLYHTINGLTLLRYQAMRSAGEPASEMTALLSAICAEVEKFDPDYFRELQDCQVAKSNPDFMSNTNDAGFITNHKDIVGQAHLQFDKDLDSASSRLLSVMPENRQWILEYMRSIDPLLAYRAFPANQDRLAQEKMLLAKILDPSVNSLMADVTNAGIQGKWMRLLEQIQFTFQKKLSHSADSQNQRHRSISATRPFLASSYSGQQDFIVPRQIRNNQQALDLFNDSMKQTYDAVNRLLDMGERPDHAIMLLPNAQAIRYYETGSLAAYHHRWKSRSCYLAQEEIYQASVEELRQIMAAWPELGQWIKAPCWLRKRAGQSPFCPEGDRFCGVRVWDLEVGQYDRLL